MALAKIYVRLFPQASPSERAPRFNFTAVSAAVSSVTAIVAILLSAWTISTASEVSAKEKLFELQSAACSDWMDTVEHPRQFMLLAENPNSPDLTLFTEKIYHDLHMLRLVFPKPMPSLSNKTLTDMNALGLYYSPQDTHMTRLRGGTLMQDSYKISEKCAVYVHSYAHISEDDGRALR